MPDRGVKLRRLAAYALALAVPFGPLAAVAGWDALRAARARKAT